VAEATLGSHHGPRSLLQVQRDVIPPSKWLAQYCEHTIKLRDVLRNLPNKVKPEISEPAFSQNNRDYPTYLFIEVAPKK